MTVYCFYTFPTNMSTISIVIYFSNNYLDLQMLFNIANNYHFLDYDLNGLFVYLYNLPFRTSPEEDDLKNDG
jgi:hypothetical protein